MFKKLLDRTHRFDVYDGLLAVSIGITAILIKHGVKHIYNTYY